jgi:hypothetical protein
MLQALEAWSVQSLTTWTPDPNHQSETCVVAVLRHMSNARQRIRRIRDVVFVPGYNHPASTAVLVRIDLS